MAASTRVLTFTWENKVEMKLEANEDGAGDVSIIEMTENGDIGSLLDAGISNAIKKYLDDLVDEIVTAMKV